MYCNWCATAASRALATVTAGQKIACGLRFIPFNLKGAVLKVRAMARVGHAAREEGAMMTTIYSFGVQLAGAAGNAGSRHAAHVAAAPRKRRNAAATDASVDQGST
jgi:hypothetical protein